MGRSVSAGKRMTGKRVRKQRGGNCGAGSGHGYTTGVVGTIGQQFDKVFGNGSSSNTVQPLQGNSNSGRFMTGGSKRRTKRGGKRSSRRSKKGGFWGQVISQAAAPFALLGLQQTIGRRRHSSGKTHRRR